MAQVVVEQGAQAAPQHASVTGDVQGVFGWLGQYWPVILAIVIILILIGVIIYVLWLWNKSRKEKDLNYQHYERTIEACKINGRKDYVIKHRRWGLLWIGLPIMLVSELVYLVLLAGEHWTIAIMIALFSFGIMIPFAWFFYKDYSMRIINCDRMTKGYYRGWARRMDGYVYILMKIGKKWLILDNNIVIRVPQNVRTIKTSIKLDKQTKERTKVNEWDNVKMDGVIENENAWYIFIPFTAMYKEASYFYDVSLVDGKGVLDLRQKIANSYHLMTQVQMAEQEYSHLGRVTSNAVDTNVSVTAAKKMPEKERSVQSDQGSTS